jgi:cyclophilin family peptidyl-prolyl cis-trans isomerase
MTMTTNHGDIVLELFDDDAPKTVGNFRKLAEDGYYDGLIFHRVIPDS